MTKLRDCFAGTPLSPVSVLFAKLKRILAKDTSSSDESVIVISKSVSTHGNSRNKIILEELHLRQCSKIFSELRGFDTGLRQLRFPANQNHTVRCARKIYSVFCWIICTQVKEGKKLRLH